MTPTQIAGLAALVGLGSVVAGAVMLWGLAVALIIAGMAVLVGALLFDPDGKRSQ